MDPIRRRLVRLAPRRVDCGLRGTARRGRPAFASLAVPATSRSARRRLATTAGSV